MKPTASSLAGSGLACLTLLAGLALGSGCSSVRDTRLAEIKPGPRCDFTEGATFDNRPSYLSAGQENAPIGALSRLFGVYNKDIHQITIRQEASRLVARFLPPTAPASRLQAALPARATAPKENSWSSTGGHRANRARPAPAASGRAWNCPARWKTIRW
ncbi:MULTISPECIES: hypothetical protein [Stenotrophomonas maltophilia group]|uniref:hypothetical protein n=1 Tax=Stenotrophomonas maltophilia group TaxID=995085 RepID=UPI00333E8A85